MHITSVPYTLYLRPIEQQYMLACAFSSVFQQILLISRWGAPIDKLCCNQGPYLAIVGSGVYQETGLDRLMLYLYSPVRYVTSHTLIAIYNTYNMYIQYIYYYMYSCGVMNLFIYLLLFIHVAKDFRYRCTKVLKWTKVSLFVLCIVNSQYVGEKKSFVFMYVHGREC